MDQLGFIYIKWTHFSRIFNPWILKISKIIKFNKLVHFSNVKNYQNKTYNNIFIDFKIYVILHIQIEEIHKDTKFQGDTRMVINLTL